MVTTTTLSPSARALRSTVATKAVMAVSGLIMVGYLLVHMYGNLMVFGGADTFNEYAHHLRVIGEPMVPPEAVLWLVRIVLLVSVIAHIVSATVLSRRSWKASQVMGGGGRYHSKRARRGVQRSFASFTMRWGGVTIAVYVVFHILHLTAKVINPGGAEDPYGRVVNSFQQWWLVAIYLVAMILVGMHLRHGVWSGLTTLGANTSATARRRLNLLAVTVAAVITVGFMLPPFAILLGLVN